MHDIFATIFVVTMVFAGTALVVGNAVAYRPFAAASATSFLVGYGLEHGSTELALFVIEVVLPIGLLFPVVMVSVTRIITVLSWRNTTKNYPDAPKEPPIERLTLAGAYRCLWPK